ncbi:MAG: DUF2752 domain-containing protein [Planctomycetaceae bacterium]|nr:DUF2752 domain-containing protein [Planctomycetaceae bacterium]
MAETTERPTNLKIKVSELLEVEPCVEADPARVARRWRQWRAYHRLMLGLASAILLAAAVMEVKPDGRVAFLVAPEHPLPELCQTKVQWGLPCPGCGLTRCFIHTVHGDLQSAAEANLAGLLVVFLVVAQVPYRLWILRRPREIVWSRWSVVVLFLIPPILLWVQWALRLFVFR